MASDLPRYGLDVWCSERYGERAAIQYEEEDEEECFEPGRPCANLFELNP